MCVSALLPCRSPVRLIRRDHTAFVIANFSSSPTGHTPISCARWCLSRSRSMSPSSNTSSSACLIRPALATTPRPDKSFRFHSVDAKAAIRTACSSTTSRRSPAGASCGQEAGAADTARRNRPDGTLDYGPVRIATGTMGYKHKSADPAAITASLKAPNYLLKIIPHVDGTARVCELVEYYLEDINLKGAWTGPGALELHPHALAPVADLPVLEVISATH